jgi:hypothetical protein
MRTFYAKMKSFRSNLEQYQTSSESNILLTLDSVSGRVYLVFRGPLENPLGMIPKSGASIPTRSVAKELFRSGL